MAEKEYLTKLNKLETTINSLKEQKDQIELKIQSLSAEKETLQEEYNLARVRQRADTTQWVEREFEWSDKIQALLREKFHFQEFRSQQLAAINATLSKKDVLVVMPTGGGKSLIYQLPALLNKRLTLVISPLISLIEDQLLALKKLGISAATINASSSKEEKQLIHDDMINQHCTISLLYVTPEWVAKSKIFMTYLQKSYQKRILKRIVIDEVHCCSTWGHDFRPEYNHLGFFTSMFLGVPILGLTATATMKVLVDIQNLLSLNDPVVITAPFNRPNLYYKIMNKPADKEECLKILENFLKHKYKDQSGIIYASTIKECEELSDSLRLRGLRVKHYHAQLQPEDKKVIHGRWLRNKYHTVVATIAFGMGIDKPDVRYVIHHSIPKSMEGLYQESGRAGRDGKNSDCILMFSMSDFLRNVTMASSKNEEKNAKSILEYCLEQTRCRRAVIAEFFEDKYTKSDCNKMCDHCRYPKEICYYDITPALEDILKLIAAASQKEIKVTLNRLLSGWFQSGSRELRISALKKPNCTKDQAEHLIGFLIYKGYLNIDKGYTMYTTVPYIQKGSVTPNTKVTMPYISDLGYQKVTTKTEIIDLKKEETITKPSSSEIKETPTKKIKLDSQLECSMFEHNP